MKDERKTKMQLIDELKELRRRIAELEVFKTECEQAEKALQEALAETKQRQSKISALLEASHAVLELREFKGTARAIFDTCKNLIGASAGYVALLSEDGTENEVLFLDSGGLPCSVDTSLPMPISADCVERHTASVKRYITTIFITVNG